MGAETRKLRVSKPNGTRAALLYTTNPQQIEVMEVGLKSKRSAKPVY